MFSGEIAYINCPACYCSRVSNKGALPIPNSVFGELRKDFLEPGELFHCLNCDLYFRYPYLSEVTLQKLYENMPLDSWGDRSEDRYWVVIHKLAKLYAANRSILDVGCFRGHFLKVFSKDWHKMGIELNKMARKEAEASGIEFIDDTPQHILSVSGSVGIITIIDVLEHIVDPFQFIKPFVKMLAPNGSIIIATGAADSFLFKIFGCNYWYCGLPEHVSFFTLRWFRWTANQLGLSVAYFRYVPSQERGLSSLCAGFIKLCIYALVKHFPPSGCFRSSLLKLPLFSRIANWKYPSSSIRGAKDHIVIVLKKS